MQKQREHNYVLTVENPHPARQPTTMRITGWGVEHVKERAAEALKTIAGRWGLSALALSWDLEAAR